MKKILLLLNFFLCFLFSYAQQPIPVETSFYSFKGIKGNVETVFEQNDGKILIGGFFTYNAGAKKNLLRLNSDGSEDTSFNINSGLNGTVTTITQQNDGKILVGGAFTNYQGNTQNRLLRLNNDGTLDSTFNIGTGFNSNVNTIALQSDNKIVVGGSFSAFQGNSQSRLIRLNPDGSKDTTFNIGSGPASTVHSIVFQNDGKMIIGGNFTTFNGISQKSLIRLNSDGTKDSSFNIGSGFVGAVRTIAVQNDDKIVVGGSFANFKNSSQNKLIRLNTDGSKDTTFEVGTGFDLDVNSISISDDQKIVIGGSFKTYNGGNENAIIKLNDDGTKDSNFITNNSNSTNLTISKIIHSSNQKLLIGGNLISYNTNFSNPIIKLNQNGDIDSSFNIFNDLGFNSSIFSIQFQDDNKIIAGGNFTSYRNNTENRLIRLNSDKTKDNSFNTGTGFNDYVKTIKLLDDGKILVCGPFTLYNGMTQNRFVKLNQDGTIDNTFNIGSGFNGVVDTFCIQNDGKIVIGGNFSTYNNTTINKSLIRLNPDGTIDNSFLYNGEFTPLAIYSIVQQNDGKLLIGGLFQTASGPSKHLTRINNDGSTDNSFNIGTGFNNTVLSIVLQDDHKIIIGGNFTSFNGNTQNRLIRLNSDGSKDTSFNINNGFDQSINNIKLQNDAKIVLGGSFTTYNGTSSNKLIRLNNNGSIDTTFNIGTGFDEFISEIVIQNDSNLLIGGGFDNYNGTASSGLIRLKPENTLNLDNLDFGNAVDIYPNPSNSIINLNLKKNSLNTNVSIINSIGNILKYYPNFDKNSINISNLPKGIYILKIEIDKKIITKKIIKE